MESFMYWIGYLEGFVVGNCVLAAIIWGGIYLIYRLCSSSSKKKNAQRNNGTENGVRR